MADRTRRRKKISDEVLDELLGGQDAAEVFRRGMLIDDLKKAVAERTLDADMEAHPKREGEQDDRNHRNGHNCKRMQTDSGAKAGTATPPIHTTLAGITWRGFSVSTGQSQHA